MRIHDILEFDGNRVRESSFIWSTLYCITAVHDKYSYVLDSL